MTDQLSPSTLPRLTLRPASRREKPPRHWLDLTADDRIAALKELGQPAFRAKQINTHLCEHFSTDPSTWTDLPATLRDTVAESLLPQLLTDTDSLRCDGDTTVKTLWRLCDGSLVESVLMRYPSRATLCVSSQAGCAMACPFCATGQGGLQRNLSTAEILMQVVDGFRRLQSGEIPGEPIRVSNVVFMGMGEPMANYNKLMAAIRTMIAPAPSGLGMSARGITVSTVGLVPRMKQLAEEGLPVTLALSLHAPTDELRNELVPINTHYSVAETIAAAYNYFEVTGRRVSIEYAMMRDINDSAEMADELARVLAKHGRHWVHVNLIPLNPTPGSRWTASRPQDEKEFVRRLEARGIATTVRETRGREIDGACGQLAAKNTKD
ncbi:MAG: 23S rRNA (adenine(2503)-C(2))-methyltransferase RlmN [Propionibacteriaceae bacterium]